MSAPRLGVASILHPFPQDPRATARWILDTVGDALSEVVFVNSRPMFGLAFYLRAQVERVYLHPAHVAALGYRSSSEALREEVAERDLATLFLVEERDQGDFCDHLYEIGWCAERLASRDPLALYGRVEPCGAAGRAATCRSPAEGD